MSTLSGKPILSKMNLLVSHAFLRTDVRFSEYVLALAPFLNLMIDSGAFSNYSAKLKAAKNGLKYNPITLEEYINAGQKYYHGRVWQYVMLDVIRNREASEYNLQAMLDAGLRPMPVFIEGYAYEQILDLIKINRRICVAGGVGSADQYIYQRYQKAYAASKGQALIHGLGFLRWPDVFQLPLATGDSSTSSSGARFGHISFYDKRQGTKRIHWKDLLSPKGKNAPYYSELLGKMRSYGITIEQMKNPASYSKMHGIHSLLELFAAVQFQDHATEVGFGMFMAISKSTWLHMLFAVLTALDDNGFDYNQAVFWTNHLREMWNEKNDTGWRKVVDHCINQLMTKTDWQAKTLQDDQVVPVGAQFYPPKESVSDAST